MSLYSTRITWADIRLQILSFDVGLRNYHIIISLKKGIFARKYCLTRYFPLSGNRNFKFNL